MEISNQCVFVKEDVLQIKLPPYFRNNYWAESFGLLYNIPNDIKKTITILEIDIQDCLWIDPIPLISILVLIRQEYSKKEIKIFLPKIGQNESQDKVLKFLYEEGFYQQFLSLEAEIIFQEDQDVKNLRELNVILNYYECNLLGVKIIDTSTICNSDNDFYNYIDKLIEEITININEKKIPQFAHNDLLYKIYTILAETIYNTYKHAYPIEEKKNVGIYIRYRLGLRNSSISGAYRKKLSKLLFHEYNNSSTVSKEFLQLLFSADGCLEIFIIDAGIGISSSLGLRNTHEKYPGRKAFLDIYETEQRKRISTEKNETKVSGLVLLKKLISKESDFILGKDIDEWVGARLPDIKKSSYYHVILPKDDLFHTPGCIWQMSLSWTNHNYNQSDEWKNVPYEIHQDLLNVYKLSDDEIKNNTDSVVIDERFEQRGFFKARKDYFKKIIEENKSKDIIYLPQANATKHLIAYTILPYIAENISRSASLIIADIPENEKITYISALNGSVFSLENQKLMSRFTSVILISQSLSVTILVFEDRTFTIDEYSRELLFKVDSSFNIKYILSSLIRHDSNKVWDKIKTKGKYSIFINELIEWGDKEPSTIDGFLDYNQLSGIPEYNDILSYSVRRILGIVNFKISRVKGLDLLVENFVNNILFLFSNVHDRNNNNFTFYLGSIYVKGEIQREAVLNMETDNIIFHCFQHPSSISTPIFRLFLWPSKDWINRNLDRNLELSANPINLIDSETQKKEKESHKCNYERLGKTHAITVGGWNFFKLPRYDESGKSFYYRSPRDTYRDWQGVKYGLNIGNYRYSNHYDLIRIDIRSAIERAFFEIDDLALFIVINFFYALGGGDIIDKKLSEIDDTSLHEVNDIINYLKEEKDLRDSLLKDPDYWSYIVDKYSERLFYKKTACVVYPFHYHTNLVNIKINEILKECLTDKIIPLFSIRNDNSKSSVLFSPLNWDLIKSLLHKSQTLNLNEESAKEELIDKKEVLFFDDVITGGRTRKEIKHLMHHLGATDVKTLAIIDRQRLPYGLPNINRQRYYWRLDVPRLGNVNINPINTALKIGKDYKHRFIDSIQDRIIQWEESWSEIYSFQINTSHGLNSYNIKIDNPLKLYGIKEDNTFPGGYKQVGAQDVEDKSKHINITSSIGLLTFCIEMQTMTGRDDFILKYCRSSEIPDYVKAELICAQLLLLGNEIRFSLKLELLKYLIDTTNQTYADNHSILSALTILNQSDDCLEKILKYATSKSIVNIDLSIALSLYMITTNKPIYNELRRIIIDNSINKKIELRRSLNYELYEKRQAHISPINAYISNRQTDLKSMTIKLSYSLEKIKFILDNLDYYAFEGEINKEYLYKEIDDIIFYVNELLDLLDEHTINDDAVKKIESRKSLIMIYLQTSLLNKLEEIHSNLLLKISNKMESDNNIKSKFRDIIEDINNNNSWENIALSKEKYELASNLKKQNPIIKISSKGIDTLVELSKVELLFMWLPYDSLIKNHIQNIISNIVHGNYILFTDPYDEHSTKAHLWYSFELDENNMVFMIEFINPVINIKEALEKAKASNKHEKDHCFELGCETIYEEFSNNSNLLKTTLKMKIV